MRLIPSTVPVCCIVKATLFRLGLLLACFFCFIQRTGGSASSPCSLGNSHVSNLFSMAYKRLASIGQCASAANPFAMTTPLKFSSLDTTLLHTLDGGVHAIKRSTGEILWSQPDLGGPLLQTRQIDLPSIADGTDLARTTPPDPSTKLQYIPSAEDGGTIYMHDGSPGGGVRRLPLSIKELAGLPAFCAPDGSVFTAQRTSQLYEVDGKTGRVIRVYGTEEELWKDSPAAATPLASAPATADLQVIFLSRTTYRVSIYSPPLPTSPGTPRAPLWNVSYSEIHPSLDYLSAFAPGEERARAKEENGAAHDGLGLYTYHGGIKTLALAAPRGRTEAPTWSASLPSLSPVLVAHDLLAGSDGSVHLHTSTLASTDSLLQGSPLGERLLGGARPKEKSVQVLSSAPGSYYAVSHNEGASIPTSDSESDPSSPGSLLGVHPIHPLPHAEAAGQGGWTALPQWAAGVDVPWAQHGSGKGENSDEEAKKSRGKFLRFAYRIFEDGSSLNVDRIVKWAFISKLILILIVFRIITWVVFFIYRLFCGSPWMDRIEARRRWFRKIHKRRGWMKKYDLWMDEWDLVDKDLPYGAESRMDALLRPRYPIRPFLRAGAQWYQRSFGAKMDAVYESACTNLRLCPPKPDREVSESASMVDSGVGEMESSISNPPNALSRIADAPEEGSSDGGEDEEDEELFLTSGDEEDEGISDPEADDHDDGDDERAVGRGTGRRASSVGVRRRRGTGEGRRRLGQDEFQRIIKGEDGWIHVGALSISTSDILGYGSHGTVVMSGRFQGREVAVKRVLLDFYTIAAHEVTILQSSDDHPHIVRYYGKEQCERFAYIAVERCVASLADVLPGVRSLGTAAPTIEEGLLPTPRKALMQLASGLAHLHSLRLVHRDLKPQNILLSGAGRLLISDFGLCKRLEGPVSSYGLTVAVSAGGGMGHGVGTVGWRAPECLTHTMEMEGGGGAEGGASAGPRFTRAVDVFGMGCVFYYILTRGGHPFGERYAREGNILLGVMDLSALDENDPKMLLARDLIRWMLQPNPRSRPTSLQILDHPYFWSSGKQLSFLMDLSDRLERERDLERGMGKGAKGGAGASGLPSPGTSPRSPGFAMEGSALVRRFDAGAEEVWGRLSPSGVSIIGDWRRQVDGRLLQDLGKRRSYDGQSLRELLRAIRNKRHHFQELPAPVRALFGSDGAEDYLRYWTERFPSLTLWVWRTTREWEGLEGGGPLREEGVMRPYFGPEEEE